MVQMIVKGMLVSGSLIMAIGSQNAFVLKQGLLKKDIFLVCLICFLCDFLLMLFGVLGIGEIINANIFLTITLAVLGSAFLFYYGYTSFKNAFKSLDPISLDLPEPLGESAYKKIILATLAVTLLNPHVYLDTVVIIGGIAGTLSLVNKVYFLIGALFSSLVWFFGLGYGARLLTPILANSRNWRILEFIIGCIMWYIAYGLICFSWSIINKGLS